MTIAEIIAAAVLLPWAWWHHVAVLLVELLEGIVLALVFAPLGAEL